MSYLSSGIFEHGFLEILHVHCDRKLKRIGSGKPPGAAAYVRPPE
jgi:hypothetical protein